MVNREKSEIVTDNFQKITRSSMRNITILTEITSHLSFMADVQFLKIRKVAAEFEYRKLF
jgi:hypothetical protein